MGVKKVRIFYEGKMKIIKELTLNNLDSVAKDFSYLYFMSKKHLTRDTDECLCNTDGVKREDLVYSLSDWKKLPQSQQCKKCINEREKLKKTKDSLCII